MAHTRLEGFIGAFSSQKDAEFACRALVEIGRFDSRLVSVVENDGEDMADRYFVVLNDTPTSVTQAKTFLKGAMPQMKDAEEDLRHEARQSAERMKVTPLIGGIGF